MLNLHESLVTPKEMRDSLTPRGYRFALQSAAQRLLGDYRVAECLIKPAPDDSPTSSVSLEYSRGGRHEAPRAKFGQLVVCASTWHCPICSYQIATERRALLQGGLDRSPYYAALVTYTFAHSASDNLADILERFKKARTSTRNGKSWKLFKERHDIKHNLMSLEVTHGQNGWHPHYHELMLMESKPDTEQMQDWLGARYIRILNKHGLHGASGVALDVRTHQKIGAEYLAKFGHSPSYDWKISDEMARGGTKLARLADSRSPFHLLHDYAFNRDRRSGSLFREYAIAFHGSHSLRFGNGAKDALGLTDTPVDDDEELADDIREDDQVIAQLTLDQWRRILNKRLRYDLLQYVERVSGDYESIKHWLVNNLY